MNGKLFLIDGHALIFKMYYAFLHRPMINSKGVDTSILFGFTKYILELIDREKPTHFAVAFDPPGGTFRNEMYPPYKANRPPTPQLVIDALEPLTELCSAMKIPVLMLRGYEADDVIGTVAKRYASEGLDVYMVTPDKDYGQLISEGINQYKPGKSGNDNDIIDTAGICSRYCIETPLQVIDMLAICGDTADNVPGVKGIGEVGAAKLIAKYGSVENIYSHIDELSPRQKAMFEQARAHIALSKDLVTIRTNVPITTDIDAMAVNLDYDSAVAELFERYEFNSLKRFIPKCSLESISCSSASSCSVSVHSCSAEQLCACALASGSCAIRIIADGEGVFAPIRYAFVVSRDGETLVSAQGNVMQFAAIFSSEAVSKCGNDIKSQLSHLANGGVELRGRLKDVALMHYLVNPERSHALDALAKSYLDINLSTIQSSTSTGSLFDESASSAEEEHNYVEELAVVLLLADKLDAELHRTGLDKLYWQIEEPLLKVLARMERNGVKVDLPSLRKFAATLRANMLSHEMKVRELAGEPQLNVSSPKQIGAVLFEKMALDPKAKKSSRGAWSTDEETLLALADRSPIIDEILSFRAAKKLLSTYIEPFPNYVSEVDGRVHTTFNQALTATGRLSSSNPNLQNIPIRTEMGKEIRRAFVAGHSGWCILSADYSQIELRIMAHLSCDQHLVDAFNSGLDVHSATAAKIYSVPIDQVTPAQRRVAKTANFGIMYGISSFGLAQRLRCSRTEAKKIIDDYFASFPSVRIFIDDAVAAARKTGYVETLFGRRRYIPDIDAKNMTVRSLAERNAVNAPIQGTSADIIKLAMVAIDRKMQERGMKSLMVLQIHDELLFEVEPSEKDALQKIVVEEMENVVKLSVPLTVECSYGQNWLESHQ